MRREMEGRRQMKEHTVQLIEEPQKQERNDKRMQKQSRRRVKERRHKKETAKSSGNGETKIGEGKCTIVKKGQIQCLLCI